MTQIPLVRLAWCRSQHTSRICIRRFWIIRITFAVKIGQGTTDRMKDRFGCASVPSLAAAAGEHVRVSFSLQQENYLRMEAHKQCLDLRARKHTCYTVILNISQIVHNLRYTLARYCIIISDIIACLCQMCKSKYLVTSAAYTHYFVGTQGFYGALYNAVGMRTKDG